MFEENQSSKISRWSGRTELLGTALLLAFALVILASFAFTIAYVFSDVTTALVAPYQNSEDIHE